MTTLLPSLPSEESWGILAKSRGWGRASLHAVGVHAVALGRQQIVDAPPAHLQQGEIDDKHPEGKAL